jgi:predicted nucleic acid binding AN1-type Zn finger protein
MEFPDLGKYCSFKECKRLDFLPFKCDLCKLYFCAEHRKCEAHKCSELAKKMAEQFIPICPLCNQAINVPKGQAIDFVVDRHIESGCQMGKRQKNICTYKNCKRSEVYELICPSCQQNFCFIHRQMELHNCPGLEKRPQFHCAKSALHNTKKAKEAAHDFAG